MTKDLQDKSADAAVPTQITAVTTNGTSTATNGTSSSHIAKKNNESSYLIRPHFTKKFRPTIVKNIIHRVLFEKLANSQYNADVCAQWTRELSDDIKAQMKELNLPRYKYVVNVVIGEKRGEGVRMGCRCFWDSDTDNYAYDVFMNVTWHRQFRNHTNCWQETIFCVASVFGVYYY